MKVYELYNYLRENLKRGNNDFEAKQILAEYAGLDRSVNLISIRLDEADPVFVRRCISAMETRNSGVPLYQILGCADFYGFRFKVTPETLIPRQDTETLVDIAIEYARRRSDNGTPLKKAVDLCSGTGAVGISFARHTALHTDCVELYDGAFDVLCENSKKLAPYITTPIQADVFKFDLHGYDVVLCNPPYIAESERESLSKEVLNEPDTALFAKDNGLEYYKKLLKRVDVGAFAAFEIGYTQGESVCELFEKANFKNVRVHKDLCGQDRVVTGEK